MSLITRCPVCTTMFKVVPDQLRVSDGWVRCGQCNEVFDANAHFENVLRLLDPVSCPSDGLFGQGYGEQIVEVAVVSAP